METVQGESSLVSVYIVVMYHHQFFKRIERMACEDFPCCSHESGCCPDFDESGRQLNMKCVCGAVVDINSRYSLCEGCLRRDDEEFDDLSLDFDDDDHYPGEDMDGDHDSAMTSAGFGTDEDYGHYGGEDDWLDGSHEE